MADHGEKTTLAPVSNSRREWVDAESVVCESMRQSFSVALCIC